MPACNYGSTRQLRSGKHQLTGVAPYRLPTASMVMASQALDIVMSEEIITDGLSQATDVDAAMVDDMAAGSWREDTAATPASIMKDTAPTDDFGPSIEDATPASIIEQIIPGGTRPSTSTDGRTGQLSEETAPASIMDDTTPTGDLAPSSEDLALASIVEDTMPGDIRPSTLIKASTGQLSEDAVEAAAPANIVEGIISSDNQTSIYDKALTHVNILDPASAKAAVDDESTIVAIDEDTPIPVETTRGEELSVVSVSTGNVGHDTIIVEEEEEDARFEIDEERPRVEMTQSRAAGGSIQPIIMEDDDEQMRRQLTFMTLYEETSRMKIWSLNTAATIAFPDLPDSFLLAHLDFRDD